MAHFITRRHLSRRALLGFLQFCGELGNHLGSGNIFTGFLCLRRTRQASRDEFPARIAKLNAASHRFMHKGGKRFPFIQDSLGLFAKRRRNTERWEGGGLHSFLLCDANAIHYTRTFLKTGDSS